MASRWMKVLACGVASIVADGVAAQTQPRPYHNVDYQFIVQIPRGVTIETSRAPNPNHGLRAHLGPSTDAWVFAEYETENIHTLEAEVAQYVGMSRGDRCGLTERKATRLGGVPAAELTLRFGSGGAASIRREILAMRSPPRHGIIIYHVMVKYPRGSRTGAEAERVFRALAGGMSFTNDP